jgi:hypothetical protein
MPAHADGLNSPVQVFVNQACPEYEGSALICTPQSKSTICNLAMNEAHHQIKYSQVTNPSASICIRRYLIVDPGLMLQLCPQFSALPFIFWWKYDFETLHKILYTILMTTYLSCLKYASRFRTTNINVDCNRFLH